MLLCVISAFDVQCPHSSQRRMVAKAFCNGSEISKYSCLYDILNHTYIESCDRIPDFVRPGEKYVIMGSRTGRNCSTERYQPFKFWSNESSDCVYQKSLCNEIGQTTCQRRSTKEDTTCTCDHTKGYGFVTQPKNIQYCIPSKEDCSCYLVQYADNNTRSSDYKCRPDLKQKNENNSAVNNTRVINSSISNEDDGMVVDGRPIIIIRVLCILAMCYIVIAFIFVIVISTYNIPFSTVTNYIWPNKWCCTDGHRQEIPPLRDRIISNFSSLIRGLDSRIFQDLSNLNLVTEQEVKKERRNQPNRFILIKLIDNCGKLDKEIESILYKRTRIHTIRQGPILARRWPKRDEAECLNKLKSAQKLQDDLLPGKIIDFFFENFIFNMKQYKKCIEKEEIRKEMMNYFIKKATQTLHNGSFECLMVELQRTGQSDILLELEQNLTQGISFKLEKVTDLCHNKEPTTVHLMISADGHDNLMTIIPPDTIHECSKWFIKELAMYPETVTETHIVLIPLVDNIKDRINESIKNERFNNLLERLLCKKEVVLSLAKDISTVKVTLQWGRPLQGGYSGKLEKMQFSDICKYNQSFLAREMQPQAIYKAFIDRGITLDPDDTNNNIAVLIRRICDRNYCKIFLDILKIDFEYIFRRLQHCENPYLLRENIMCNIPQLVALHSDLDDTNDIFVENNILTKDDFENIKKKCRNNPELQNTLVLVKIIRSGTPAIYLYVQQLRERGNDKVADKLSTETKDHIKYTDNFDDIQRRRSVLYMKYDVTMEPIREIDDENHMV